MKQIKSGEYKYALCSWCRAPAKWRSSGMGNNKYACHSHHANLIEYEHYRDDGRMSEADEQTWGGL